MHMIKRALLVLACLATMAQTAYAGPLRIACAANFTPAMKELAALYTDKTASQVDCAFGSTGMLYGQIKNGAPFDLFFAADEKRPGLLHDEGLAARPEVYARGTVVLWTKDKELAGMGDWKQAVVSENVARIGLANPKTAPYGAKAQKAMAGAGLWEALSPKIAYGKNVGMAFQYAYSGSAQASFVALSQALSDKGKQGAYFTVEQAGLVPQAACVLSSGDKAGADAFMAWLKTPAAQTIIRRYGYE